MHRTSRDRAVVLRLDPRQNLHASLLVAPTEDKFDGAHHRRTTKLAGHDHHIYALHVVERPPLPKRSKNVQLITRLQSCDGLGDSPNDANGVVRGLRLIGVRDDRDCHLADPEQIDHVELAGREPKAPPHLLTGEAQSIRVDALRFPDLIYNGGRVDQTKKMRRATFLAECAGRIWFWNGSK